MREREEVQALLRVKFLTLAVRLLLIPSELDARCPTIS